MEALKSKSVLDRCNFGNRFSQISEIDNIQINRIMMNLLNLHKVNEFENKAVEFGKLPGGGGHLTLERNMTGRCRFFKNLRNLFGKKIAL